MNFHEFINKIEETQLVKEDIGEHNTYFDLDKITNEYIQNILQDKINEYRKKKLAEKFDSQMLKRNAEKTNKKLITLQKKVNKCLTIIKDEYNTSLDIWTKNNMMSMKPYSQKYAKQFFVYLKLNMKEKVLEYLDLNPYLVFDTDYVICILTLVFANSFAHCHTPKQFIPNEQISGFECLYKRNRSIQ